MATDRRNERSQRIELDQEVVLLTSDGDRLHVKIKDISRDGFKIEHSGEDLIVGEIVTIRTGRSEARGQIQWATKSEAGGAFIDPVESIHVAR